MTIVRPHKAHHFAVLERAAQDETTFNELPNDPKDGLSSQVISPGPDIDFSKLD